jgi:hypothetical protein
MNKKSKKITKKSSSKKGSTAKRGRPTKFKDEYIELVYKLALLGATDVQMADILEIDQDTFNRWKKSKPGFYESLSKGKDIADAKVVASLYNRALGYSHPEERIFCNKDGDITRADTTKQYPPDPTSCIFWLKNRQRNHWRDKVDADITSNGEKIESVTVNVKVVNPEEEET